MQISIQLTGVKELRESLKDFSEKRMNAAVATALTRTAVQVRTKALSAMRTSLNAPTPYTQKQLKYVAANAKSLVAAVGFNISSVQDVYGKTLRYEDIGAGATPAGKYLSPQIDGGPRRNKRFEIALRSRGLLPNGWFAVPGQRAKMDAYGNQSVGEIKQILSWFNSAEPYAGSTQNMTAATKAKRIKGTKKTAGFEYFYSPIGGRRQFVRANGKGGSKKMQPGIYKRTSYALGSRVEPIIIFVSSASYQRRFDFERITLDETSRLLPSEVRRAVDESVARLNAKNA